MKKTKTLENKIKVMQAFLEGKKIQIGFRGNNPEWVDCDNPEWNWEDQNYRIKPEKKVRPMTFLELVEYWKGHRTELFNVSDRESAIITGFRYEEEKVQFSCFSLDFCDFLEMVRTEDGKKFEVIEYEDN